MNGLQKAARDYAKAGWLIFPLEPGGKKPLTAHGFMDAEGDPAQVKLWWEKWPDANIGWAVHGGFVVVDLDGLEGKNTIRQRVLTGEFMPVTLRVITGRGQHLYFTHDGTIKNSAGKIGPGVDIRTKGGYVVLPPSVHPDGNRYVWKHADDLKNKGYAEQAVPDWDEILPLPAWLAELANPTPVMRKPRGRRHQPFNRDFQTESAYLRAAIRGEVDRVADAHEGERNTTLNSAAFSLGQLIAGMTLGRREADLIVGLLTTAAIESGLEPREIEPTIASGLAAGMEKPRHP